MEPIGSAGFLTSVLGGMIVAAANWLFNGADREKKLDAADRPDALDLPGMAFHPLKGDLKGFYAVTVRANWRLIYRFENGNAYDVSLIDYH